MKKTSKVIAWIAGGTAIVLASLLIFVLLFNWNLARPWINERVSQAIGRPFAIQGDLSLSWTNPDKKAHGGRSWVPWPHLSAKDVQIANPDWATTGPTMATFNDISFSLNPLALLTGKIIIPSLRFDEPNLVLERNKDGKNNWTFRNEQTQSRWEVIIQKLVLIKGTARLVDAIKKADIRANLHTLDETGKDGYGVGWSMKGKFNGEPASGGGKAGSVLSLESQVAPYPVQADIRIGKSRIGIEGTLIKPSNLAALDLNLRLSGASMAHLYPIIGVLLPDTPPFSTQGHLSGTLSARGGDWIYDKFSGKVGSSDLSGTLEFRSRETRPLLTGNITSNLLRFEDLAPLIGADSKANKANRGAPSTQPPGKVLPTEPFRTERWRSIDADVTFTGHRIVRSKELPIDNLNTHLKLENGILNLVPLNFGVAGGTFRSDIRLDGSGPIIKAEMKVEARHLLLKKLFPTFQPMRTSLGEVNGAAALTATGNSVAALFGSANGEIKMLINQGTVSKLLLEGMGLNIGSFVLTTIFGDRQVNINCLVSDFVVVNDLASARTFIVDTDDASIYVNGQVNLTREQLNLAIDPKTKGIRIISLRTPLYLTGTFKNPDISLNKGVLALKAGSAAILAAAAPLAALIPLTNLGQEENQCAALLKNASKKPAAGPPRPAEAGPARSKGTIPAQPSGAIPAQSPR